MLGLIYGSSDFGKLPYTPTQIFCLGELGEVGCDNGIKLHLEPLVALLRVCAS